MVHLRRKHKSILLKSLNIVNNILTGKYIQRTLTQMTDRSGSSLDARDSDQWYMGGPSSWSDLSGQLR